MYRVSTVHVLMLSIVGLWQVTGCADMQFYNDDSKRQEVEASTPAFNPAYFKDKERRHLAVAFEIVEGKLKLDFRPAQLRPGNMPYRTAAMGEVLVLYRDAAGKELGRYAIENPVLARSCDAGGRKPFGETKRLDGARVEILLPDEPAIHSVEIGLVNEEGRSFDVSERVKNRGMAKQVR